MIGKNARWPICHQRAHSAPQPVNIAEWHCKGIFRCDTDNLGHDKLASTGFDADTPPDFHQFKRADDLDQKPANACNPSENLERINSVEAGNQRVDSAFWS